MARIGPEHDASRLRELLDGVEARARSAGSAWRTDTHIGLDGAVVSLDLRDLDRAQVELAITRVLDHADALWSERFRFNVGEHEQTRDGVALLPATLAHLRTLTLEGGSVWRVSRREGRPYVDIRRPEVQRPTPAPSPARGTRRRPDAPPTPEAPPTAEPAPDLTSEIWGAMFAFALVLPAFGAWYTLLRLLLGLVPPGRVVPVALSAFALLIAYAIIAVLVARRLVLARHVIPCGSCGALNRVVPFTRKLGLVCRCCADPIFGARPIKPHLDLACPSCASPARMLRRHVVEGLPTCPRCQGALLVNARVRQRRLSFGRIRR